MKKILFLVALVVTMGMVHAQEGGKEKMLVDYFSYPGSINGKHAESVRDHVITGINEVGRLIVIDVDSESTLRIEADRRSTELAMEEQSNRNDKMKNLNATYAVTGNVNNITASRTVTDKGDSYYDATISFTIKVINIADGTIKATESIELSTIGDTSEEAIINAISGINSRMETFIDTHFPLTAKIVEVKEVKNNKLLKSCYVNLGSAHGIAAGQYITVFHIKSIAGRESKIEIGRLKVKEVVAPDLSDCVVTKGGKQIYEVIANANGKGIDELTLQTQKDAGIGGALKDIGISF